MVERLPNIAWGIGFLLLYVLVLQPVVVAAFYRLLESEPKPGAALTKLAALSLGLLSLPFVIPPALAVIRAFYGMMAVTNIQKVVSYWKERGPRPNDANAKCDYLEFMNGLTTNYWEQPAPLEPGEEVPAPHRLRLAALAKFTLLAASAFLNVRFELWRGTPPLAATFVKSLLFVVFMSAQQDLVHAALVASGRKPALRIVDLRLFSADTYEQVLVRLNPVTHKWLYRYVYLPLGGNRHPVRNKLGAYALSGLWHEYLLIAASLEVTGLWLAYFLANGIIASLETVLVPRRDALLDRFRPSSFSTGLVRRGIHLTNFLANVCVAHLMFLGLELIVELH